MIATENPEEKKDATPDDLKFAIQDLRRAQGLLRMDIAGSSKWIEIVLFILRMISYILGKLPIGDKEDKAELTANGAELAKLQNHIEQIAKDKRSLYPISKGGCCGETKV